MVRALGYLLAGIFAVLGLLHFYWAAGGQFGSSAAVPSVDGKRTFDPSTTATILVGLALIAAMLVVLGRLGWMKFFPASIFRVGTLVLSVLFLIRAIGDFRILGFFKNESDSSFAYWDNFLFSPLCLLIAIVGFLITFVEIDQ